MKRIGRSIILLTGVVVALTSCSSKTPIPIPTPTVTAPIKPPQMSQIFYVGDTPAGFRLFSENYQVADLSNSSLTKLVSDLLDGKAQPKDPDYTNLWGKGSSLISLKVGIPSVTVDIHLGKPNWGSEVEMRAIDEILWTVSKFMPKITSMSLLVDGKTVESLAGHVDATKAFLLGPTYDVLSPLQISSIYSGEKLKSPVLVQGEACTFEANVAWKLFKNQIMLKSGAVTAKEACPTRSLWSLDLGKLDPAKYQLLVQDFSAKDGSLIAQDSKDFEVVKG
jgi:hypothetical protein